MFKTVRGVKKAFFIIFIIILPTASPTLNSNIPIEIPQFTKANNIGMSPFVIINGSGEEKYYHLVEENDNYFYITGTTNSSNIGDKKFTIKGEKDIFLIKSSKTGEIIFTTVFGGSSYDIPYQILVSDTKIFVIGETYSDDFPTLPYGPAKINNTNPDLFVAILSKNGTLENVVSFGSDAFELFFAAKIDHEGNLLVLGHAGSNNLTLINPLFETPGSIHWNSFLIKIHPTGKILFSTLLTTKIGDFRSLAIDSKNNIIIAGTTWSEGLYLKNSIQSFQGGTDGYVIKIDPDAKQVIFATYLGGSLHEELGRNKLLVNDKDEVMVLIRTFSLDMPLKNPIVEKRNNGYPENYLAKLDPYGNLLFATYFGGGGNDGGVIYAVPNSNVTAIFAGETTSARDFRPLDVKQNSPLGSYDVVFGRINLSTNKVMATVFGSDDQDIIRTVYITKEGIILALVDVRGENFPTINKLEELNPDYFYHYFFVVLDNNLKIKMSTPIFEKEEIKPVFLKAIGNTALIILNKNGSIIIYKLELGPILLETSKTNNSLLGFPLSSITTMFLLTALTIKKIKHRRSRFFKH